MKRVHKKEFRIEIIDCSPKGYPYFIPVLFRAQVKGRFFWHTVAEFASEIVMESAVPAPTWYDYGMFQAQELIGILQKVN